MLFTNFRSQKLKFNCITYSKFEILKWVKKNALNKFDYYKLSYFNFENDFKIFNNNYLILY